MTTSGHWVWCSMSLSATWTLELAIFDVAVWCACLMMQQRNYCMNRGKLTLQSTINNTLLQWLWSAEAAGFLRPLFVFLARTSCLPYAEQVWLLAHFSRVVSPKSIGMCWDEKWCTHMDMSISWPWLRFKMLVRHSNTWQLPCKRPHADLLVPCPHAESEREQYMPSSHIDRLGGQQHLEVDSV